MVMLAAASAAVSAMAVALAARETGIMQLVNRPIMCPLSYRFEGRYYVGTDAEPRLYYDECTRTRNSGYRKRQAKEQFRDEDSMQVAAQCPLGTVCRSANPLYPWPRIVCRQEGRRDFSVVIQGHRTSPCPPGT